MHVRTDNEVKIALTGCNATGHRAATGVQAFRNLSLIPNKIKEERENGPPL